MSYRDWLRPPRHLVALFLVLTLVPSLLLIAFGWRLLEQDLELERQQAEAGREQAADLIVAALEQNLTTAEAALRDARGFPSIAGSEDAVVVLFESGNARAEPAHRLLFYPVPSPGPEAPAATFADGETLEFRDRDYRRAADWFRRLARSSSAPVRAGALIRLARNLRRSGAFDEALATYGRIQPSDAAVGGVPADLLARWARCELLAELGRTTELQDEARLLARDVLAGRWRLDRTQFQIHLADAQRWSGRPEGPAPAAIALASSVEWLYGRWRRTSPGEAFSGRTARTVDDVTTTVLWQGTGDRAAVFVAGPGYLESQWMAKLEPLQDRHGVRTVLGEPPERLSSTSARPRAAAETGLPWTVLVDGTASAATNRFAGRRTVWLAGLGIIALLVVTGTYVVVRAVSRELAVARLQSDFVSAVSHEFRTPLTSLRQLTEMLSDRPSTPVDRRQTYYAALARQTERLHRLVESLLDFGRMEAGTSPYRLAPVEAGALIGEVVRQFAADAAARDHEVRLQVAAPAAGISADRDALTNAIWNLLDNAAKYSPGAALIRVDVAVEGSSLAIHVRDEGMGIPGAEQREIFGKFVRGATARAGNISGTGIGLAMVSHIVAAHRGTVSVESAPGAGSVFTIRLPLVDAGTSATREAACLGS
jgi:signal transduction histidine kinase